MFNQCRPRKAIARYVGAESVQQGMKDGKQGSSSYLRNNARFGEAGEHIMSGHMRNLRFRPVALGDIHVCGEEPAVVDRRATHV
jgi:hypothetical protein